MIPDLRNLALAVLVTAGASSFVAFRQGESHERGRRAQIDLAASAAASEASSAAQSSIDSLSLEAAGIETTRQDAVRTIREHTREIIREPAMAGPCLPVPAVGVLDAATDVANGQPAHQSVPAGPSAGTAETSPAG